MELRIFIILFSALNFLSIQETQNFGIISAFKEIKTTPQIIKFKNSFEINNDGGHLQGIQMFETYSGKYLFLSGSSNSYAYVTIVKWDETNDVISVNRLMDKPFKHAGGFQIYKNYLAVGIEDNDKKDKSKVCIYQISDPEIFDINPVYSIERKGEEMRSTAGCVGITEYKNEFLVAVGDWDTKHIDFYLGNPEDSTKNAFKLVKSINTGNLSKEGWVDDYWHPYQNINLFNADGVIFMIGLGQNKDSENVADLYQLQENGPYDFVPVKKATKSFVCTNSCTFKAGAGVYFSNGKMNILACCNNITETSVLNLFSDE